MLGRDELIVDCFAGGGGASVAIEQALGRAPDIAINHDPVAVAMHAANHPDTEHFCSNIHQVDPRDVTRRGPIGLGWFSPDCTHYSRARGGRPVRRHLRDLAHVVVHWAEYARPRIMFIENVEEFLTWGPVDLDGNIIQDRKGEYFRQWVAKLRRRGYSVQWQRIRACDFGAPTIRRRLFIVARRDRQPIVWPAPTHGAPDDPEVRDGRKLPWRTAAECIDFTRPCPSIFLSREAGRKHGVNRPLAAKTLARIARGIDKYVLRSGKPFLVPVTHSGGGPRCYGTDDPLPTITCANRGELALAAPFFTPRHGERPGQEPRCRDADAPLPTVTGTANGASLVAAFLAQHNTGVIGREARDPLSTITARGTQQQVVAVHMINQKGRDQASRAVGDPAPTICAGAGHAGVVAAFLQQYYSTGGQHQACDTPLGAIPTRDRFGVVMVRIDGESYVLADIGMRMLHLDELFACQGFPADYDIRPRHAGRPISKTDGHRLVGNSVSPPPAAALIRANCGAEAAVPAGEAA